MTSPSITKHYSSPADSSPVMPHTHESASCTPRGIIPEHLIKRIDERFRTYNPDRFLSDHQQISADFRQGRENTYFPSDQFSSLSKLKKTDE